MRKWGASAMDGYAASRVLRRFGSLVSVVALATVGVIAEASPAAAASATCGMTVTGNLQLDTDLTCPGTALILGADANIDLNGHTITGPGSSTSSSGINASEHRAFVQSGTIQTSASGLPQPWEPW